MPKTMALAAVDAVGSSVAVYYPERITFLCTRYRAFEVSQVAVLLTVETHSITTLSQLNLEFCDIPSWCFLQTTLVGKHTITGRVARV